MLAVVDKFHRVGSMRCKRKGHVGLRSDSHDQYESRACFGFIVWEVCVANVKVTWGCAVTVTTNTNHALVLNQVLQSSKRNLLGPSLKLNINTRSLHGMFKIITRFACKIQTGHHLTAANKCVRESGATIVETKPSRTIIKIEYQ
ncbi:hypothetical protein QE152_g38232 [Popillia japonica]|uniref:Uncharacterized protein n=1 Tax=Popillia japonica TaxID=7064 RepID=A0AAW1I8J2_POPJA